MIFRRRSRPNDKSPSEGITEQPLADDVLTASISESGRLLLDDPLERVGQEHDPLGRRPFIRAAVELLERIKVPGHSSVVALIGPWGSGKSTVLNEVAHQLTVGPTPWIIAQFNPWSYSDLPSMSVGFFSELREALPKDARWSVARDRLSDFAGAIAPLGGIGSLVGVDASAMLEKSSEIIRGSRSATNAKHRASEALGKFDAPILVVLDDLDRLDPDELLLVFKLVRLLGHLPNVNYLLSYDEKTLLDTLSRTQLAFGDKERAQDYLQKIVQVRFDMPPMREEQVANFFNSRLHRVLALHEVQPSDWDVARVRRAFREGFVKRLSTPRSVQRFVAQLHSSFGQLHDEVDVADFLIVTFLRTEFPLIYNLLPLHRSELTMTDARWTSSTESEPSSIRQRWQARIEMTSPAADSQEVMKLLAQLFVPIQSAVEQMKYDAGFLEAVYARKGIGHIDYFDRYFNFAIPADDISDEAITKGLEALGSGRNSNAKAAFVRAFIQRNSLVIRKLENRFDLVTTAAAPLLIMAADNFSDINSRERSSMTTDPLWRVAAFCAQALLSISDPSQAANLIRRMATTDGGASLAAEIFDRVKLSRASATSADDQRELPFSQLSDTWWDFVESAMREALLDRLDEYKLTRSPLTEVPRSAVQIFYSLRNLNRETADRWMRHQVVSGQWTLLDALALLIPVRVYLGTDTDPPPTYLGDVDLVEIDEIYGLQFVRRQLKSEMAAVDPPSQRLDDTSQNRYRWLLAHLIDRQT